MPDLDQAAVEKIVGNVVGTAISTALKPLSDTIGELTKNQKVLADTYAADKKVAEDAVKVAADAAKKDAAKNDAGAPKPLTAEEVAKQTADLIAKALGDRDKAQQSSQQRNAFVAEKLKGLPPAYADKLGNDPAKWADEEKTLRENFKADMEKLGLKVPAVGGNPGGQGTSAAVNATVTARPSTGADLSPGATKFAAGMELPTR
jgi:ABC-type transporter Mla subunit MlaD